jgi:hypothetical protein
MINIDLAYKISNRLLNDNQITDRFPPEDWNRYATLAQLEALNALRKAFESSSINTDNIAELKVRKQFILDNGRLTKPDDYLFFSAPLTRVWYKDGQGIQRTSLRPVDFVTDNELGDRLNSQFDKPTYEYPIVQDISGYLQFYPEDLTMADLMYIREPREPKWAYTEVDGEAVYDPINSVDFELPINMTGEIIYRIMQYMGVNVRSADAVQYAISKEQQ